MRIIHPILCGTIALVLSLSLGTQAQSLSTTLQENNSVMIQTFDQLDGLPVVSLSDITLGADGYLYIASYAGVSRFNGTSFDLISSEKYPDMISNRIQSLFASPDSSIWMISEEGLLSRWYKGHFEMLERLNTFPDSLSMFKISERGSVWLSGIHKTFVYKKDTGFIPLEYKSSKTIIDFIPVSDTEAWYLYSDGLYYYASGEITRNYPISELPYSTLKGGQNSLVLLPGGRLMIMGIKKVVVINPSTFQKTVHTYDKDSQALPTVINPIDSTHVLLTTFGGFFELDFDKPLISTIPQTKGLYAGSATYPPSWKGKRLFISFKQVQYNGEIIYDTRSGNRIVNAAEDREGNLWLTTAGNGLIRISVSPFSTLNKASGLPGENIYSTIEDTAGNIWLAAFDAGILRITENTYDFWGGDSFDFFNELGRSLFQSKTGSIYAGMWASGLEDFTDGVWSDFLIITESGEAIYPTTESYYENSRNDLWLGTRDGLFKRNNGDSVFRKISASDDTELPVVQVMTEGEDAKIWMGTASGLYLMKEGAVYKMEIDSSLTTSVSIRDILVKEEYVWIATQEMGLIRARISPEGQLTNPAFLTKRDGLADIGVHRILEDHYGYFWLTTNQGINRVKETALNTYLDKSTTSLWIETFIEKDGLPIRETNGGTQSSGLLASDGTMWIPTQRGVILFNPGNFLDRNPFKTTQISVSSVQTESNSYPLYDEHELVLTKGERSVILNFDLLHYTNPENLSIEYRITDINNIWQELSSDHRLSVTNLPPGSHRIQTRLAGIPTDMNPMSEFTLEVPFYFWERSWFFILLVGLVITLIAFVYLATLRVSKKREQVLNVRVRERTELLNQQKAETEKALKTIQHQAKELKKLNRVKTDFFIHMTHELRTPLTLIKGPLNLLQDNTRRDDINQEEQLNLIKRNSTHLNNVVDQLLNLLRLETEQVEKKSKKIDLTGFVRIHAAQFESTEELQGKTYLYPTHSEIIYIIADPESLTIVFNNLISNAIKYTDEGDSIDLKVYSENNWQIFEVTDSGIGISQEDLEFIFEPFYRSENVSSSKGSGVGLSIVKDYIDRLGGKIDIKSKLGKGTTIKLYFPTPKPETLHSIEEFIEKNTDEENLYRTPPSKTVVTTTSKEEIPSKKPIILLVEDNADLQLFLNRLLENKYTVDTVGNGVQALGYLKDNSPDLIITDVMMPQMDGFTLVQNIRAEKSLRLLPIIILSAKKSEASITEGLLSGAQVYITKPLENNILMAQIETLLEREMKLQKSDESPEREKPELQTNIDALILRHISDPKLSVQAIADTLHMSRPTLYRKWKEISDINLNEYIIKTRLNEAISLIEQKGYTLAETSVICGFSEPSYFSRVFKKYFGSSPSEYLSKNSK